MIVLNPNDTSHSFDIIPRYYPTDYINVFLYNEETKFTSVVNTYSILNGIMTITFNYTFIEGAKYQIKIEDANGVVYRDKMFITSQNTQEFKATKDHYYYE